MFNQVVSTHSTEQAKTSVKGGDGAAWIDLQPEESPLQFCLFFSSLEDMAEWAHNVMQQAHKLMEEK